MKIKQLHIRNIASIVSADIDFESDLNDPVTGSSTGIFLISGDTGAGKSAILDAISMALYKDTPRLDGVANKKRNSFNNGLNDDINIDSIQQYTRLGISAKDESYSEVVFEATDGEEYTVRLSLGFVRGEKNYKSVQWEYRKTGEDWQRVDAKTGQPILQLVGLSFEQFGRMAMLAQGQFASFLVGDKKERESILEQLTNTESFTRYGQAIRELFKAKKGEYEAAKKVYESEQTHLLTREQVDELSRHQTQLDAEAQKIRMQIAAEDERLGLVSQILKEESKKTEAQRQQAQCDALRLSDAHRLQRKLVADWTETEAERARFRQLLSARETQTMALADETRQKEVCALLLADIAAREALLHDKELSVSREEKWLAAREDRKALYEAQSGLSVAMARYRQDAAKLEQGRRQLADETGKTKELKNKVEEAEKACRTARESLDAKQTQADALRKVVDTLNPAEISCQLDVLTAQVNTLMLLKARVEGLKNDVRQLAVDRHELDATTARLSLLNTAMEARRVTCEAARTKLDEANKRLTTMGASLDTQLSEIRSRLIDEHEDFCPLCGQKLHHELLARDNFEKILSPIRQEQAEAICTFEAAEQAYNIARTEYNTCEGALKSRTSTVSQSLVRIRQIQTDILAGWESLTGTRPVPQTADVWAETAHLALEERHRQIGQLRTKQDKVSTLQKELNRINDEKSLLSVAHSRSEQSLLNARNMLKNNSETISRLTGETVCGSQELHELFITINATLVPFYPHWEDAMDETVRMLAGEVEEYRQKQAACTTHQAELDKDRIMLDGLRGQAETLSRDYPTAISCLVPDVVPAPQLYPCSDIRSEWSVLIGSFNRIRSVMEGCRTTMDDCAAVLNDYYRRSGNDEAMLAALMQRSGEIENARREVTRLDQDLKSCSDAIRSADASILKDMETLGVSRREDVPSLQALQAVKDALTARLDEVNQQLGSVTSALKDNLANKAKAQTAESLFQEKEDVYQRWTVFDKYFGDTKLRTLVQSYVLRPLLNNANIYLQQITDRYKLTCSKDNEQLSILVHDLYNKGQLRSATLLSGGERFMISLALSLALSSLNRQDMNVNILFIDEGFGTLDEKSLNSVMATLEKLQEIAGQSNRRVGIISHREELAERIPVQIRVTKRGEGRSFIEVTHLG